MGGEVYVDPKTKFHYPLDYAMGPRELEEGEEQKVGDEAIRERREKMGRDFLLLMRGQTFLPAAVKSMLKFMQKSWKNAMPSHWYEVIRGLYEKDLLSATMNADGNPTEVWF